MSHNILPTVAELSGEMRERLAKVNQMQILGRMKASLFLHLPCNQFYPGV